MHHAQDHAHAPAHAHIPAYAHIPGPTPLDFDIPASREPQKPRKDQKVLDFFLPMQTRKWLQLLRDDPVSGIRVAPNLDLDDSELGFSFASNRFGLRGPDNPRAENVIFGTSFAMGFAVDKGRNWYDACLDGSGWFNAGLPVGLHQQEALFNQVHEGDRRTALILYHPNIWTFTKQYEGWAESGQPAFAFFRWQTDRADCFKLQLRVLKQRQEKIRSGTALSFTHKGARHYVDSRVCLFDFNADWDVFLRGVMAWKRMLDGFRRAVFLRIPMKPELCIFPRVHQSFRDAKKNYDFGWLMTRELLGDLPHVRFTEPGGFGLEDYHPLDGHWNESGNAKFAAHVREALAAY